MGTLAVGLGCFPFDRETYLTQSDSWTHLSGIQSLIRIGNLSAPPLFSALPPVNISKASPKAISGRTSYIRVRLEFLRYPHIIRQLFNGGRFGPPLSFTSTSTCTWIGHPVSGLMKLTFALFTLGFPSAPYLQYLTSPAPETRRTVLQKVPHRGRAALCACKHKISGSISLPARGSFHLSFTVLLLYRSPGSI